MGLTVLDDIYQHFRKEEKQFIDLAMDWKEFVERTYAEKLTDFLDPRQQFILQSVVGDGPDVRYAFLEEVLLVSVKGHSFFRII